PRPVDAFDHIEDRQGVAHLVGLQRPDQVQGELGKFLAQRRILRLRLLDPILAEKPMARRQRLPHGLSWMGLADGDQRDALRRAPGSLRSFLDPVPDGGEIGGDNLFHSSSIPGKDRPMPAFHYPLSAALAASLSFTLAGCAANPPTQQSSAPPAATNSQQA